MYPFLDKFTNRVKKPTREIVGREKEIQMLMAALLRPEISNVILLGEAGSGKTMLVQSVSILDTNRMYLEVDLAKMIANLNDKNEMAEKVKQLFDETIAYCRDNNKEIVLFIDEFHQIVQLSPVAVEALKPLLADSATRGIRVIAATTYAEFLEYISPNQPLVERLQRINIKQPDKNITIKILEEMVAKYQIETSSYDVSILEAIYDATNQYIPSNSQPRKSIMVLDAMIGWHRLTGKVMDHKLLAEVIYQTEGINVAFRVDATKIRQELNKHVLAQEYASCAIEKRLHLCIAGLNNPNKPMSSFLFTGSTGVGKTEMAKQLARILFDDDRNLIRFDMSEFANASALRRFQIELTTAIWEHPFSILLMDEIEKSCPEVTRLLLQVLDDGRLMNENGRVVPFTNSYIILTTNAGSEIYKNIAQYHENAHGVGNWIEDYEKLIRTSLTAEGGNKFPPELLGRIDAIIPFQPLAVATQKAIVTNKLLELKNDVKKKYNINLEFDKNVVDYIVDDHADTDSDSGGARTIMSIVEKEIKTNLAIAINNYPDVKNLFIIVAGEMASKNKSMLKSKAYIMIATVKNDKYVQLV